MRHSLFLIVISFIATFSSSVFANLALSEYRLYFDGRTKNNSLMIRNTSDKNLDFRLVLVHKDMTEEGNLINVSEADVQGRSAKSMLRYSPRRGTIKPKGMQAIRMTVRKKADLIPGEYRAVLKIIASEAQVPNEAGISIKPKVAYSIPVIVRHGRLEVESDIVNPQLVTQNGQPTVMFWQTLNGNRSLFGDFKILNEDEEVIGEIRNLGVYTPLTRRKVFIPLTENASGPLTILYEENIRYGGKVSLTETLNINE
jgi:P pilus assembly chaperone PapD